MNEINQYHGSAFEEIKQRNDFGQDFWSARRLSSVLGYLEYRNFLPVIVKAKEACINSKQAVTDHFVDMHEMVDIGSGAKRKVDDVGLSRYACYLIVQNADPSKEIVALGQTYFAVQTRKQELIEQTDFRGLDENKKRLLLRDEMRTHNKQLADAAKNAGVIQPLDYAPSLRQIFSAQHRRKKNLNVKTLRDGLRRIKRTLRLARKFAKPLKNWAAPCRNICPRWKV